MKNLYKAIALATLVTWFSGASAQFICQSAFSYSVGHDTASFNNTSQHTSNAGVSYVFKWEFGDGTVSTDSCCPLHVYADTGTYTVCLVMYTIAQNTEVCGDSTCQQVHISSGSACGNINGTWTYTQVSPTDTVHFTCHVDSTNWGNSWTFGDGGVATGHNPTHYFAQPGTYNVCRIIAYNNGGCRDTVCQSITVHNYCATLTAYWLDSLVSGTKYRFYTIDTNTLAHHVWAFGDGTNVSSTDTTHTYANAGTYTACLYVYIPGSNCPTDSLCRTITVGSTNPCLTNINGAWTYSQTYPYDTIHFTSAVDSTNWGNVWTFGDGTSSTSPYPVHYYAQSGNYNVCRIITYNNTCHDTICQTITVANYCAGWNANWTYTAGSGDSIYFTAADTQSFAHFDWNCGDGNFIFGKNTSHLYAAAGRYKVCLYVYGGNCPVDSICDSITVGSNVNPCASLNAYYGYSQISGTDSFHFTGYIDSSYWHNLWVFGDGTYSTLVNPGHTFAPGTYSVCRYVSDSVGGLACRDSFCRSITVTAPCTYNITAAWTDSVSGLNIKVFASDTNTAAHHIFSFGDGTSVSARDTSHTYAAPGKYRVCLYVYVPGTACPTDSLCDSIQVVSTSGCGVASFLDYVYNGDQIHAYSNSTGTTSASMYGWKVFNASGTLVEDTITSANSFMSHALANGTYTLCLALYASPNLLLCDSFCSSITINNPCGWLNANWTWSETSSISDSVQFNSTVDSTDWTYQWIFGDGTTSTSPNLIHHYNQPGTYTVCHIVGKSGLTCADTLCQSITVTGSPHCGTAVISDYIYGNNSIHAFDTATNNPSGTIYAWSIYGPNGNLIQSKSSDTSYILSIPLTNGTYTVCLRLYTANNLLCDSTCTTVTVTNSTTCSGLNAAWSQTYLTNNNVKFTPADSSASISYYWVFGDGTTSHDIAPTHAYANGGLYHVCLYVSYANTNCIDSSCANIQANASGCNASFTYVLASNTNYTVEFINTSTSTDSITTYGWSFGDGTSSTSKSPSHTYTTAGTYYVCMYIVAANGCESHFCDSVHVTGNPCAGFNSYWSSTVLQNGNIQFRAYDTSSVVHRYWKFGDGTSTTNSIDPVHAYANPGTYTVCLFDYIPGTTCIDSTCTNITVGSSSCSASFTYQSYYPPYNSVNFTNTSASSDSIISYYWTFGDNTSSSDKNISHTYPHSGYWYTCLTITTLHGCSSTYCDSVYVQYNPCYGLSATYTYSYTNSGGVHFVPSTSSNTNVYNLWIFGDGTTSTNTDPTHYYTQPGAYTVCHITGIQGSCADTSCETIQGTGTGTGCQANFSVQLNDTTKHAIFTSTSTSGDSIISYAWTFGNGNTASHSVTDQTYNSNGPFDVCLTIATANGCSSTYCDSISFVQSNTNVCHASFTSTLDTCQLLSFTNTSTGGYNHFYWNFGDGSAVDTVADPTHIFPVGTWTVTLEIYSTTNGCQAATTETVTVAACGNIGNDTICGTVFYDLNGNGVQNTGEHGVPNAEIHIGNFVAHADSSGHYQIILPAGTYTIYYCAPDSYAFTIPVNSITPNTNTTCAAYQNVQISSGSNCGFNFGIQINSVTICGTVYFDANDNHAQDPGEAGIPNARVALTDSATGAVTVVYTDQYGNYCAVVPTGVYSVSASAGSYTGATVYPTSIKVYATTNGQSYGSNNFGLYVQPGTCDLSIKVTPNTNVTPGYPAWYNIEVCNVGTNVTSGVVNMFYDPKLSFNYASPAQTSQNSTTYTVTWDLNNLLPGSCQYYWVSLTADSNLTLGESIFTLVNVTTTSCTDADFSNNVDTLHQAVNASWDPNNKTVTPIGQGPEGLVKNDQLLTYTINFENDGTAPAVNIVIHDTLSANLDLSTFKMLGASSPFTMQLNGNVAVWKFNGIMLPDSATDAQGSRGFVSYWIAPLQNLPQGTQITNTANVYFDYNAGVATNTTLNTIDYNLAVTDIVQSNVTITLQPNPFTDFTTIRIQGSEAPYEMKIFDMMGQVVGGQTADNNVITINRNNLASGVYMYQILKDGKLLGKGKMIAQ